jgi:hypothetical protein
MISIEKTNDYKTYIEKALGESSFVNTFKKSFNLKTKEECLEHELNAYSKMSDFQFYSITDNDMFVGYFGSEGNDFKYLTTFFIEKSYRNKDFYKLFLDNLYDKLGDVFGAYRFNRNLKAERFIENLGGKALVDTSKYRLYIFNRSK